MVYDPAEELALDSLASLVGGEVGCAVAVTARTEFSKDINRILNGVLQRRVIVLHAIGKVREVRFTFKRRISIESLEN